ncbi:TPA: hypothetical protein N0F65_008149 [Lagenidium giganteum]|uniref:Fe2OG dioxygenase domain-containing protein n=1 Tax=Lagenidium giganteum TaxID=4803 RepID=A0AAV2YB79_9STRA|nr:TPA: hypothetical protein N0F65_008149 [Lagenidium giganteum]
MPSPANELTFSEYVTDELPSQFLRLTMSRRVKDAWIAEPLLRAFLIDVLAPIGDTIGASPVQRIRYGSGVRKNVLVELGSVEAAMHIKQQLHQQPSALIHKSVMYVEFAIARKDKEERERLLRVQSVARVQALEHGMSTRVPGLLILPEFISRDEELALLRELDADDKQRWKNTVKARQVQHFGYEFNYDTRRCDESKPLEPMVPHMQTLIDRIPTSIMASPDQITVNEYLPGQGIAAHLDTHSAFTNAIASLSLENEIVMEFRHPDGRCEGFLLQPRSLVVMTGASRYEWTHAIPPRTFDIIDGKKVLRKRRVSVTFRKVQSTPCTCAFPLQCDVEERCIAAEHALAVQQQAQKDAEAAAMAGNGDTLAPTPVEQQFVHEFYETVAGHFSSTRYNPWPRVAEFVRSIPPGSLIADVGCGNGKYMKIVPPTQSAIVGGDRCSNLIKICKGHDLNVMVCDALAVPIRSSSCDAALSIAVLHHLSTLHHRLTAVKELIRVLRVGGRAIIYAWAHEQKSDSKRQFDPTKQDFMVPWNLDKRFASVPSSEQPQPIADASDEQQASKESKKTDPIVVQRYCHMFKEGELQELIEKAGNAVVEDQYYDESNWAIIFRRIN